VQRGRAGYLGGAGLGGKASRARLLLVTVFLRRPSADWPRRHRVWYRSHVETLADRQIVSTRVVDAPRARVFRAWTDPAHLVRWWGPKGFTNTFHEFDLRPGGTWRFVMRAPNGAEFQNTSVFVEIVAPEGIVFRHESPPEFQVTATFAEQAGKTRISFQMLFESADACEKVRSFAPEANEQNFDRLEAELTRMS
jgi:uncharacterized protein YndB with AHSA1/START domain